MSFHFLRPLWLFTFFPLFLLTLHLLKRQSATHMWSQACDEHLLPFLLLQRAKASKTISTILMISSMSFMILALAGPTWLKNTVPSYQRLKPRLILLDLSQSMLTQDISPDRLTRAKFKIHDLLMQPNAGQFGLIAYTSEAFVVSPITDDAQTIDALLSSLTPSIMPVEGHRLEEALTDAQNMLKTMGLGFGELLVLTATTPSTQAVDAAHELAENGYHVSVIPLSQDQATLPLFAPLARAGQGKVLRFTDTSEDIKQWLALKHHSDQYQVNEHDDIPLWQDEGRWFLFPALLLLLPAFQRHWLTRFRT